MTQRSQNTNNPANGKQRARATKRDIISRVKSLYSILFISALAVTARLLWIILFSPAVIHNAQVMDDGIYRTNTIKAHRGTTFSRDGEPLAISSLRYKVILDFGSEGMITSDSMTYIKNADRLSNLLADHFNQDDAREHGYKYKSAKEYRDILLKERWRNGKKRRAYAILPRTITIDEWHMMKRSYPIFDGNMGMVFNATPDNERLYPSDDIARQTIGRYDTIVVNGKKVAGTGLEAQYNDYLRGRDGKVKEQWIAHGFWTHTHDKDNIDVEDGANVISTIDAGIQRIAHERLDSMLRMEQASFGVAIVMEVETGNILAMVNLGSGVERGVSYSERVNNHALKTAIGPGSTMKLATTMALLEIGGYNLDTKVNTEHSRPGKRVMVGKAPIEDSHDVAGKESDGNVTLKDAFAHSSNVYFAKAVYERFKDNPAEYTDFLAKFKFNDYVGLQEYGAVRGRLITADSPEWNTRGSTSTRLPRLAYGYEIDVTPLHMITFYNGVANDGRMVAPRLVDRIERDGEVVERMPVVPLVEKMCSESTLRQLDSCLAASARRSAYKFRDLVIPFGCKTGTAQMWSTFISDSRIDYEQMKNGINGKEDNYYYGSIICTMPMDKPRYTILVGVCKQWIKGVSERYFGIDLAGPVASDIMEYIYTTDPTLHHILEESAAAHAPTSIKAGSSKDVKSIGKTHTNQVVDKSEGSVWSRSTISADGTTTMTSVEIGDSRVPDVRGMGLSDALYLLESCGLKVTHTGSGAVKNQSIPAGREINKSDLTIHLTLGR
ncbi:MAG: PASTA domain-containing protein [Alistipes sp.]|nr:PASTA domain-containing protein [Alistipes sp.]